MACSVHPALGTLATAVNSHHTALQGELVAIRTVQDGLASTVRSNAHELSSRVQSLDAELETRSDSLQRELHELGRSAALQHTQLAEHVAAIRDLVREDGTVHGRTADTLTRNLEETPLSVEKLAGSVHAQHGVALVV